MILVVGAVLAIAPARADSDETPGSATQKPQDRSAGVNAARALDDEESKEPSIFEGIAALNPIDTARDRLRDHDGIYFHGAYIGDPYADVAGGMRRGGTYAGRLDIELDVDAKKVAGLDGGTFHANMYQIEGRDVSRLFVGNLLTSNSITALPTTRLYELWYEQRLGDVLAVRAGQLGADVEFLTSNYAANFVDETFGWPGLTSLDLPQGGPSYPLATPAVRAKIDPARGLSILVAVFNGLPAGPGRGDPQGRDPNGVAFRTSDPPLALLEAQYRHNRGPGDVGLPGTLKLGAFSHFGQFGDQQFAVGGVPLAVAGPGDAPIRHSPDAGGYAILDQQIYRAPGADPAKGIGVFARLIGAPPDRNLIDLYADAGFFALGIVPGRPDDGSGVAAAVAKVSCAAQAADREADAISGIKAPVRDYEALVEATYQIAVLRGLTLQPTVQYIMHPGANVADPLGNGLTPIPDAVVLGVTTTVRF